MLQNPSISSRKHFLQNGKLTKYYYEAPEYGTKEAILTRPEMLHRLLQKKAGNVDDADDYLDHHIVLDHITFIASE